MTDPLSPVDHRPGDAVWAPGSRGLERVVLLVVLVNGAHAAAGGGAAVLRILTEGHNVLHPVLLKLLQGLGGERSGVPDNSRH